MDKSNIIRESFLSESVKLYHGLRIIRSEVGDHSTIGDDCDIVNLKMEDKTELGRRNLIRDSVIGRGSYTGTDTIIKNAQIGRFCSISWNVSIGGGNHDYYRTSMYTDYWYNRNFGIALPEGQKQKKTIIGNDVWIGAGVIINSGVSIGNGCVIGAGSVVVRDIPDWSIVVGVPGKVIKKRFDQDITNALDLLEWWNWDDELIIKYHVFLKSNPNADTIKKIAEEIHAQNTDK